MQEETYTIPQMVEDVRGGKLPRRHFIKTLAAMGISAAGIEAIGAAASRPLVTTAAPRPKVHEEPKTHVGDLPGLPASGRQFSLRGVTVVVREQGKIVREAIYYDVSELHRQLGQVR